MYHHRPGEAPDHANSKATGRTAPQSPIPASVPPARPQDPRPSEAVRRTQPEANAKASRCALSLFKPPRNSAPAASACHGQSAHRSSGARAVATATSASRAAPIALCQMMVCCAAVMARKAAARTNAQPGRQRRPQETASRTSVTGSATAAPRVIAANDPPPIRSAQPLSRNVALWIGVRKST